MPTSIRKGTLFIALLLASINAIAQKISYDGTAVPLSSVIAAVEQQTEYVFVYTDPMLKASKPVTVSAQDLSIHEFLTVVFKSQPLDRKSTRLNSSHVKISYAVFCLKKKKK